MFTKMADLNKIEARNTNIGQIFFEEVDNDGGNNPLGIYQYYYNLYKNSEKDLREIELARTELEEIGYVFE